MPRDAALAVAHIVQLVVGPTIAVLHHSRTGDGGLACAHILVGQGQCDARHSVTRHLKGCSQRIQIACRGRVAAGTIVDLGGDWGIQSHRLGRDVGRRCAWHRDDVIGDVIAAVADIQVDRLARTRMSVGKCAVSVHGKTVANDPARSAAHAHGGRVVSVVHLVGCRDAADRDRLGRDVRRGAGLVGDDVVANVITVVAAAQGHHLVGSHMFVAEQARG